MFDGLDLAFARGDRVLIKPNLLLPASPEKAVLTHPLVVRAAAEYVLEKGGRPLVADSPATGSMENILKTGGFHRELAGLPVACRPFTDPVKVDVGAPFGTIEIAREAIETDVVINLPKLKTHAMMHLTLGVKNLFGCVVGLAKPRWHFRVGVDKAMFAELLVRISRAVAPAVTLVDGILAMEGQGPGKGGTPRYLGFLAASESPVAVDMAISQILGLDPLALETSRAAARMGLVPSPPVLRGGFPEVKGFRFPEQGPVTFGPRPFHAFFRRHLVQRPVVSDRSCRLCGKCWEYCPANAITAAPPTIRFDYDACIRCYCCIEVCPHGALAAVETPVGRLVRLLGERKKGRR